MKSESIWSPSIAALAAALAKAQLEIEPARKDAINPHFRSHYADLASIMDACRGPLAVNGLAVCQMPIDCESGRVALETIIMHSSGEWIASIVSTPLQKNDAQGIGSALTYLRRYSLSAMVGVTSCEDDDGNAASKPRVAARDETPSKFVAGLVEVQKNAERNRSSTATLAPIGAMVTGVEEKSGVTKAGKPYTKFRVCWEDGGDLYQGTTFSASHAKIANEAIDARKACVISTTDGKFGLDITDIAIVQKGLDDGIPF